MNLISQLLRFGIFMVPALVTSSSFAVDYDKIEKELNGPGALGWIHGASESQELFVFTYRNPEDFFDYVQMSLVAKNSAIAQQLTTLSRHDQVLVHGKFLKNPSPQKHISVDAITLAKKYQTPNPTSGYPHQATLPDELLQMSSATFLVHAVAEGGHILVLEYKDSIVPVYVKNEFFTKDLFRNDLISLKYNIQAKPEQPTHLVLDEKVASPVIVIESIASLHGKPASVTGALVMFPKSPEIIFNVFAVQQLLPAGLNRQYTLVNFDNPAVFAKIRAALQKAWDEHPGEFTNGRNKLVSTRIEVTATGIFNEVDASQANPQVLLKSLDDLKITIK